MATRTITIDLEAYRRLASVRAENESFSQVIKRVVRRPVNLPDLLARIRAHPLSEEAVRAIEEQIEQRGLRHSSRSE